MSNKEIGTLTYKISVEDAEKSLVKAMEMSKSKLIEWREVMASHNYQDRVKEIQGWINILVEAQEEEK